MTGDDAVFERMRGGRRENGVVIDTGGERVLLEGGDDGWAEELHRDGVMVWIEQEVLRVPGEWILDDKDEIEHSVARVDIGLRDYTGSIGEGVGGRGKGLQEVLGASVLRKRGDGHITHA